MLAARQYSHTKSKIAKQFSRAAENYDCAANVQADIAQDALALLPQYAANLLDIGAGTGRNSPYLLQHCDHLFALDIAFGMLDYSRRQYALNDTCNKTSIFWLQGDAEHLPLQNNSIDGVFSSMVLQWCQDRQRVMSELHRVMVSGGLSVLAIMVEDSFSELTSSWQRVDSAKHVNDFACAEDWAHAAREQGLDVTCEIKPYVTWHTDIRALLASIKSIGANVVVDSTTSNEHKTALNRKVLQRLDAEYRKKFLNNGQLPLTYQVCYLQCRKP